MLQSLVERFTGPRVEAFIKRVEQDEKATVLEQRKVSAAQKAAAQKTLDQESPAFRRVIEAVDRDRESVKKRHAEELAQLDKRLEPAQRDLTSLEMRCRRIIDGADYYLASTADPKIKQFQKELEERRGSLSPEAQSGKSFQGKLVITHSTHESVNAAVDRINRIICDDLKKLALQPLSEIELSEALEDLRQSIPAIVMKPVR
jgi:hypothetical protein